MLTKRNAKMLSAAIGGLVIVASASIPAQAQGGWLWLESGSLFPTYQDAIATPMPQPVQRIVRSRPVRVAAVAPAPVVSGNFWARSRVYVSGLSF